jgi:hypothetical protein
VDRVLWETDWGGGIVGHVADNARRRARDHRWASHWLSLALRSEDPIDVWRFAALASQCADARLLDVLAETDIPSPTVDEFFCELREQIAALAERRTNERRDTLFGRKAGTFNESVIRACRQAR